MGVLRKGTIFLLALGAIKNKDGPVDFTGYVTDCYIPTYDDVINRCVLLHWLTDIAGNSVFTM